MYFISLFSRATSDLGKSVKFLSVCIFLGFIFIASGYFISLVWITQSYHIFNLLVTLFLLIILSFIYMQALRIALGVIDRNRVSFRNFFNLSKRDSFVGNVYTALNIYITCYFLNSLNFSKVIRFFFVYIFFFHATFSRFIYCSSFSYCNILFNDCLSTYGSYLNFNII